MKDNRKKEAIVLICSAFIVLSALTTTGLFLRTKNMVDKQDGYVVDLSSIEQSVENATANSTPSQQPAPPATPFDETELDYDPTFPEPQLNISEPILEAPTPPKEPVIQETIGPVVEDTEALSFTNQPTLGFQDNDMLQWPVVGDVLINFSMDKTVYYPTLDQYKYNPGIVISAAQGTSITAPATGRVVEVKADPQYGNMVIMDLGDGYELSCGQLDQITVSEGSFVTVGEPLGLVASPTKYFSLEGSNLFLMLEKDGTPISPLSRLQ